MALITDLPTNSSPSTSDYLVTDNGTTTSKSTITAIKRAMGFDSAVMILSKAVTAGNTATFTLENNTRGLLVTNGTTASIKGLSIFNCGSGGVVSITDILSAPAATVTTGANSISISGTVTVNATLIIAYGSAS